MTPVTRLPLFLTVQRHHFETPAGEHPALPAFRAQLQQARDQGRPAVLVQWDGDLFADRPPTFSREWVLHPDIRAEEGDLLVRASGRDPFAGQLPDGGTALTDQLRALGCTELEVLALPGAPELEAAQEYAAQHGLTLHLPPQGAGCAPASCVPAS